jgi:hypothetical protein
VRLAQKQISVVGPTSELRSFGPIKRVLPETCSQIPYAFEQARWRLVALCESAFGTTNRLNSLPRSHALKGSTTEDALDNQSKAKWVAL